MEELIAATRVALANIFVMYFRTQSFHWNVEGINFSEYHGFFGDLYEDVYGAVDPMAENLRKLGAYAPRNLIELYDHATLEENDVTDLLGMLQATLKANSEVIDSLNKVFDLATANKQQGLADYVSGRIDTHKKHEWMIKSCLK